MEQYELIDRLPTIDEYRTLCTAVGWGDIVNFAAAPTSLANSPFGVVVIHNGATIGMGRVVGDGAMYFYVQDVVVLPQHQHRRLGHRIVDRLLERIEEHTTPPVFVGLFATDHAMQLYQRFGFQMHPGMTGMFVVTPHRRVSDS
ncbi:MAG TPA: GNAT family N-acetyltransferase [Roseiflexaceae bacterium]|nr:GNAT family N-acetyltransferase [Roseiflexaceae bacterium]HMP42697.1 GNAT family N-acetyltransferase [Roseiflexaceae bacterium]